MKQPQDFSHIMPQCLCNWPFIWCQLINLLCLLLSYTLSQSKPTGNGKLAYMPLTFHLSIIFHVSTQTFCFMPVSCYFHVWLTLWPWRSRSHVPPEHWLGSLVPISMVLYPMGQNCSLISVSIQDNIIWHSVNKNDSKWYCIDFKKKLCYCVWMFI